jgi:hypothetical protein
VRTKERSWVRIPKRDIPVTLSNLFSSLPDHFSDRLKDPISRLFDKDGNFWTSPIPAEFPINLANYRPIVDFSSDDVDGKADHEKNFKALLETFAENLPLPASSESCAFKRTPGPAHRVNDGNLVAVLQILADSLKRVHSGYAPFFENLRGSYP